MKTPLPVIGVTDMAFGFNMFLNLARLGNRVNHAELLFYWTRSENNFLNKKQLARLAGLARRLNLSLSVHLPGGLDLVTAGAKETDRNLDLILELIENLEVLAPAAYVLHLGPNPPSFSAKPQNYIYADTNRNLAPWYDIGASVLEKIQSQTALDTRLLVENLDFSPLLLKPFLQAGLAGLCLDMGHTWLGNEPLAPVIEVVGPYIKETHLHGVCNGKEHLALDVLNESQWQEMRTALSQTAGRGPVVLEVFSMEDLDASLKCLAQNGFEFIDGF